MDFRQLLEKMMEAGASDLHLKVGTRPNLRVDGALFPTDDSPPTAKDLDAVLDQVLNPRQKEDFLQNREIDFAFGVPGLARFRANFFYQRGTVAMAVRHVPLGVPAIEDLNLPTIVEQLALRPRGLILVTGTVGSGKSTTLAAMIDAVNRTVARNVITVEDPIEFLHRDDKCVISQREVGLDTETYKGALKYILRQDPDVILLGEIRDAETMSIALMAADTGHLVLSTLHTIDAPQTVNRILSFYPPHQHAEIRFLLATTLQAVISQRLIPRAEGRGRVPAVEVMLTTSTIQDYLLSPEKTLMIKSAIQEGAKQYGMQTFDQSLMSLFRRGFITYEAALQNSSNPSELELRIRGIHSSSDTSWDAFEGPDKETQEEAEAVSNEPKDGPKGIVRY
ncbi:MAG: type IV pilus twitching motility protein PilT [Candidatus Eisenbacteria bacterium]|uniref:Type IV pilus twitching motility protein PilT n=1 Tax=Eiseniibacteriota bacterium TaxID=2212470 RepID=A0A956LXS9_UNCEI|nr:type IV pilus twitching motility protein PilT [Candidatus Eisenbacteria bacterium]